MNNTDNDIVVQIATQIIIIIVFRTFRFPLHFRHNQLITHVF